MSAAGPSLVPRKTCQAGSMLRLSFSLVWVFICVAGAPSAAAPADGKPHTKTIKIGGVGEEPTFILDISAKGRIGMIVVKDSAGTKVQTLTCDLFRDWGVDAEIGVNAETTANVIDYHAERFVSGVTAKDLDFDGLPDIQALRDFGAKFAEYCVWLYAPNQGRFEGNQLSHQMEDLINLTADAKDRQVVSYTIGPVSPSRDEYRIDDRAVVLGSRRLLPIRSCMLDTGATAEAIRTANVVTYVKGQGVIQSRLVSANCNDVCGDGCPTVSAKTAGKP
jgi:hypothetical protein